MACAQHFFRLLWLQWWFNRIHFRKASASACFNQLQQNSADPWRRNTQCPQCRRPMQGTFYELILPLPLPFSPAIFDIFRVKPLPRMKIFWWLVYTLGVLWSNSFKTPKLRNTPKHFMLHARLNMPLRQGWICPTNLKGNRYEVFAPSKKSRNRIEHVRRKKQTIKFYHAMNEKKIQPFTHFFLPLKFTTGITLGRKVFFIKWSVNFHGPTMCWCFWSSCWFFWVTPRLH